MASGSTKRPNSTPWITKSPSRTTRSGRSALIRSTTSPSFSRSMCGAMVGDFVGEAQLRCGWGEDIYFDRRGHIAVELEPADGGQCARIRRDTIGFAYEWL